MFRPYLCPCPGASCKWQGNLNEVMHHLMKIHKSITTLQGMSHFYCILGLKQISYIGVNIGYSIEYTRCRRGYSLPCHRHQSSRCSRLGDDAILFQLPFHARARETSEITLVITKPGKSEEYLIARITVESSMKFSEIA